MRSGCTRLTRVKSALRLRHSWCHNGATLVWGQEIVEDLIALHPRSLLPLEEDRGTSTRR